MIPGIGPKRKKLLLKRFGDIGAISRANPEDFILVPGINKTLAENISRFFNRFEKKDMGDNC